MTIISSDERGTAIGLDRFGFYVFVDGEAVMGPLRSRSLAVEVAELWVTTRAQRSLRPVASS